MYMAPPIRVARQFRLPHVRLLSELAGNAKLASAAKALNLSQPAASRLLREIEEIVGFPVHQKEGRGIVLSPEGRQVASRAAELIVRFDDFAQEIGAIHQGQIGRVAVGAVTAPAVEHLLPALRRLRRTAPGILVDVDVGSSDNLVPKLLAGQLDFALARRPQSVSRELLDEVPLTEEPIDFFVREGHPLAGVPALSIEETLRFDWVLPSAGNLMRNAVEAFLARRGLALPPIITSTSSFLMTLGLISHTDAVAPLASGVREAFEKQGIRSLPLRESPQVEAYAYLTRRDRAPSFATAAIVEILAETFPQLAVRL